MPASIPCSLNKLVITLCVVSNSSNPLPLELKFLNLVVNNRRFSRHKKALIRKLLVIKYYSPCFELCVFTILLQCFPWVLLVFFLSVELSHKIYNPNN